MGYGHDYTVNITKLEGEIQTVIIIVPRIVRISTFFNCNENSIGHGMCLLFGMLLSRQI